MYPLKALIILSIWLNDISFANNKLTIFLHPKALYTGHPLKLKQWSYSHYLTLSPVFVLNKRHRWTCRLCQKTPDLENQLIKIITSKNSNATKMIIKLIPQSWGDGHRISAEDIHFSWQVANSLKQDSSARDFYSQVLKVDWEPERPLKAELTLKNQEYLGAKLGKFIIIPSHLEKPIWQKRPQQYFKNSLYITQPYNPGLYIGPYLPKSPKNFILKKSHLNVHYSHIEIKTPNTSSIKTWPKNFIIPEVFPSSPLINNSPKNSKTIYGTSQDATIIAFNLRNPLFSQSMRQALYLSIDKSKFRQNNRTRASAHLSNPSGPFALPNLDHNFNPKKAQEILASLGWHYHETQKFRSKLKKTLKIPIVCPRERQTIAHTVSKLWAEVGIYAPVEISKDFTKTINKLNYTGAAIVQIKAPGDHPLYFLSHSKAIPNLNNNYQGKNIFGWHNHKVDQLLQSLNKSSVFTQRLKLDQKLQKMYHDQLPVIPLFFSRRKGIHSNSISGFVVPGHQHFSSLWADRWRS